MADLTLADAAVRARIYRRLGRRNRFISVLRIVVPLFGLVVLGVLLAYVYAANKADGYGASSVRFDRDQVIVSTPKYQGVTQNGTHYSVSAEQATTELSNADLLDLANARLEMKRPDGYAITATTDYGRYDLGAQSVLAPGVMTVEDSAGMRAWLTNSAFDWQDQVLRTRGEVRVLYPSGMEIRSAGLTYDANVGRWVFDQAQVITSPEAADLTALAPHEEPAP